MMKSAVVFAVFFFLVLFHTNKVLAKEPQVKSATVVKKAGSVALRVFSDSAVNHVVIESEASSMTAMRRPG